MAPRLLRVGESNRALCGMWCQVKAEWKRRAVDVVSEAELAQILSKVHMI
jgi:hypothetical protein